MLKELLNKLAKKIKESQNTNRETAQVKHNGMIANWAEGNSKSNIWIADDKIGSDVHTIEDDLSEVQLNTWLNKHLGMVNHTLTLTIELIVSASEDWAFNINVDNIYADIDLQVDNTKVITSEVTDVVQEGL